MKLVNKKSGQSQTRAGVYQRPAIEVIEVELESILCVSGDLSPFTPEDL